MDRKLKSNQNYYTKKNLPDVVDIENDPWIAVTLSAGDVNKNILNRFQEEVTSFVNTGYWYVYNSKAEKDWYSFWIVPNMRFISPLELEEIMPELLDIKNKIKKLNPKIKHRTGLLFEEVDEHVTKARKNMYLGKIFEGILIFSYKLKYRIMLERINFPLANLVFRSSLYLDFVPDTKITKFIRRITPYFENRKRKKLDKLLRTMILMDK